MRILNNKEICTENRCIAFGDFDGIHQGHMSVINKVVELAQSNKLKPAIVCFEYPDEIMEKQKILSTKLEKYTLLKDSGLDEIISFAAEYEFDGTDIENFINDFLCKTAGAEIIVAGKQNPQIKLIQSCSIKYGFKLIEVDTVEFENKPLTSKRILDVLCKGSLEQANRMLGHPYLIMGEVMHGKALGRTVGMPTANIGFEPWKQLPSDGVYGTLSDIDGKAVKGLTNIGKRPSVDDYDYLTIEAFLLDFSGDLYGKIISLEVHVFIRGVKKFNSIEEVKQQVNHDIDSIRAYLDKL